MALSYLTLDGREVANSARLIAFRNAGLVPSTFEIMGTECGVLDREAASNAGTVCSDLAFSDMLAEITNLGVSSIPQYSYDMPLSPQAGVGKSDGYIVPTSTSTVFPFGFPVQGNAWLNGIVVVAFETLAGANGMRVTASGRANSTYSGLPGGNSINASVVWQSATTAQLRIQQWVGDLSFISDVVSTGNFTMPTSGRMWLVLRLAGDVITGELWTSDPRMGGTPWQTVTYTLTGATIGGYATDRVLFGVAGLQTFNASQPAAGSVAIPEWWSTPACVSTCNLYPSPFLYPAPTLYPAECSSSTILATTPWTDSSRPESADFLGFYVSNIDGLDGDTTRSVDQRMGGLGGAALGPLVQAGRRLSVEGFLVARSCRGLDYGREWLLEILAATCHPCPDSIARIRVAVPSPDDGTNDAQGLYYVYDVGLTSGPQIDAPSPDCDLASVTFELTTGNGYKYQAATALVARTTFASANGSVGVQIPTPPVLGTNGAIVTIRAGSSDLVNVYPARQLSTYPASNLYPSDCLYPNDGGLPVTMPITTCPSGFLIPLLPAGGTLVIDSARHRITYTDPSGVSQDGTFLLSQNTARAIDWLEADACNPGGGDYVLVGAGSYAADASVQIDVQHRER